MNCLAALHEGEAYKIDIRTATPFMKVCIIYFWIAEPIGMPSTKSQMNFVQVNNE